MLLVAGRVGRAFGIRGEVAVEVRTDDPDTRFAVGAGLRTDPDRGVLVVERARWHSGRLLVGFAGVADRTAAEALRGTRLLVDVAADARPSDDGEAWYDHQLAGLTAVAADGSALGVVTEVLHLPAQDLLAVRTPAGAEVLVPFVRVVVPEVDLAGGRLVVTPPPGLFDPERAVVVPPAPEP